MTLLAIALFLECFVLYLGQREIFAKTSGHSNSLALFLSVPGTILHEGSHWLMCKLLLVPTGKVELFRPRKLEDGGQQLGVVYHAASDPLRGTLIAIAPLLFVPGLLFAVLRILLGPELVSDPLHAFLDAAIWKQILLFYIVLSCGSAAFPSPGDHISVLGATLLIFLLILVLIALPAQEIKNLLQILVLVLAPASFSALLQLFLLRLR